MPRLDSPWENEYYPDDDTYSMSPVQMGVCPICTYDVYDDARFAVCDRCHVTFHAMSCGAEEFMKFALCAECLEGD